MVLSILVKPRKGVFSLLRSAMVGELRTLRLTEIRTRQTTPHLWHSYPHSRYAATIYKDRRKTEALGLISE